MSKKVICGSRHNNKSTLCLKELITRQLLKEASTETLLKELIDRKVIRSWYYNGSYHVGNEPPIL
jgi:hypothetical protein